MAPKSATKLKSKLPAIDEHQAADISGELQTMTTAEEDVSTDEGSTYEPESPDAGSGIEEDYDEVTGCVKRSKGNITSEDVERAVRQDRTYEGNRKKTLRRFKEIVNRTYADAREYEYDEDVEDVLEEEHMGRYLIVVKDYKKVTPTIFKCFVKNGRKREVLYYKQLEKEVRDNGTVLVKGISVKEAEAAIEDF